MEYAGRFDVGVGPRVVGGGEAGGGVSPAAKPVRYPGDSASGEAAQDVVHWGHPLEFFLKADRMPPLRDWPVLHLSVSSLDSWDRHSPQGAGHLPLAQVAPGTEGGGLGHDPGEDLAGVRLPATANGRPVRGRRPPAEGRGLHLAAAARAGRGAGAVSYTHLRAHET